MFDSLKNRNVEKTWDSDIILINNFVYSKKKTLYDIIFKLKTIIQYKKTPLILIIWYYVYFRKLNTLHSPAGGAKQKKGINIKGYKI